MSLLAAYGFNEGVGTTSAPESGTSWPSATGVPGWAAGRHGGNAMASTGTGSVITFPSGAQFTIMLDVYLSTNGGWSSILEAPNGEFYIELGGMIIDVYAPSLAGGIQGTALATGWNHIAVVAGVSSTRLVVNGDQMVATTNTMFLPAGDYYIGGSPGQPLACRIDNLRIFDTALTDPEIQTWMATSAEDEPPAPPDEPEPIVWKRITSTTPSNVTPRVITGRAPYITSTSTNERYFLDQRGDPILVRGDSPWLLATALSEFHMATYLADRAQYGTNALIVSLIGSSIGGGALNADTFDGVNPFVGGDITVFNEPYWERMDFMIARARDLGMTMLLYPIDGWNTLPGNIFVGKSLAACQSYGQQVAARFAKYPNIVWMFGGDYAPDTTDWTNLPSTIDQQMDACLQGIRAAGDTRMVGMQFLEGLTSKQYLNGAWRVMGYWQDRTDFNFGYSYFATYAVVRLGYAEVWRAPKPTRPMLFMEGSYEGSPGGNAGVPAELRRQRGWSYTSGSYGAFTGQEGVWDFGLTWQDVLAVSNGAQLKAIDDFFLSLSDWHTLAPTDQVVVGGRGNEWILDGVSGLNSLSSDYVTVATKPDRSLTVAFVPNGNNALTIDPAHLGANPSARWVDPANGLSVGVPWSTTLSRAVANSDGGTDWFLVIESDPLP